MATPAKPTTTTSATPKPAGGSSRPVANSAAPKGNQSFLFDRNNYLWMIAGVALILIGFMLMSGGKSPDPHQFLYNEIYSFRRITLAPIIILIGFGVEVYAIMRKPAN